MLVAVILMPAWLAAQDREAVGGSAEIFVGSELEDYLRLLQIQGKSELYPWSIRALSPREVDRLAPQDTMHPWAGHYDLQPDSGGGLRWELVRPRVQAIYNSAFPYGSNDGAIWAGRGLTTAVQGGITARYGPLSLILAPVLFRAENAGFPLMPTGAAGPLAFADGRSPFAIDAPQRFGEDVYARLDAGQSTLRLELPVVSFGVSTANQQWGPAGEYPIILGNNAPGFLHAFLGTSAPLDLWVGKVHGRLVWGQLEQSEYSPVSAAETRRFMSGLVGVFTPRGVPGLEIGGSRFFHSPWPEEGLGSEQVLKPLEAFFKRSLSDANDSPDPKSDVDNQLASVFFRWVMPRNGFEVYGEYGREDHNWNLRDFLLEPDHDSAYLLGLRKVWSRSPSQFWVVRGELLNSRISHLNRVRYQTPFYVHNWTRQGHTQRGQILGSPAAYGGAGSTMAFDYYHPRGRWTASWMRTVRQERGTSFGTDLIDDQGVDVLHALGAEAVFFRGVFDITAGVTGAYDLNRNFASDVFNLNMVLGLRMGL